MEIPECENCDYVSKNFTGKLELCWFKKKTESIGNFFGKSPLWCPRRKNEKSYHDGAIYIKYE
jgi:hypothetical protein